MGCLKLTYNQYDTTLKVVYKKIDFEQNTVQRFLRRDPKSASFPFQSPYIFGNNNPIQFIDKNGEYAVALHYVITYRVMLDLGFSKDIAKKVAHYSSVYADHPDWSLFKGAMYNMNVNLIKKNGLDPKEMNYKEGVNYDQTKNSQSDYFISTVSIHAMRTFWEDITPKEAVKRALYGGEFLAKDGKTIVKIEGAYNVISRLSKTPIEKLTDDQLKELGVALHTIQDAQVHKGKRWVDEHKNEADEMDHKNEHPNSGCINGQNADDAIQKTAKQLRKFLKEAKK